MTIINEAAEAANLQDLVDIAAEDSPSPKPQSGVQRSKELEAAILKGDLDELMNLQIKLNKVVEKILTIKIDPDDLGLLDQETLTGLAVEQLDLKDIERLLEVRYQLRREAVFAHITEVNKAAGVPDAAWAPGKVMLPDIKRKWERTGGRSRNAVDQAGLKAALGDKTWAKVVDTIEIPAQEASEEQVLNEDKLYALLQEQPKLMKVLAEHVVAGGRTPQTLNLKAMTKDDVKEAQDAAVVSD